MNRSAYGENRPKVELSVSMEFLIPAKQQEIAQVNCFRGM
jgi:hypothetical protein